MAWFPRKRKVFGLDIGEDSVKLVEVVSHGENYQLKNFALASTPPGTVNGEYLQDQPALIKIIRNLAREMPESALVASAIKGQSVFVRHLQLPLMPDAELAVAINYEAQDYLPFPSQEAIIDFVKVKEVGETGNAQQEVMVVAVRKALVDQQAELIRAAGLEPVIIDVEPLALHRALAIASGDADFTASYTVVQIGLTNTNISIFHQGVLQFTRNLPIGCNRLNAALVDHYGLSLAEAESTQKLLDLSCNFTSDGMGILLCHNVEILRSILTALLAEIKRSNEYFQSKNRDSIIKQVYLTGPGAHLRGIDDFMQDGLALSVKLFNPVQYLSISPALGNGEQAIISAGATLTTAVGLALSEVS